MITWTFEPVADEDTHPSFQSDYTVPIPIVGQLAQVIVHGIHPREADPLVANIKARMEG